MEHTIPITPMAVMQAILRELVTQRDPEASFVDADPDPEPEAPSSGLYGA